MGSRRVEKGSAILDALFALLMAAGLLLATLGLFSRLLRSSGEWQDHVESEIEERNTHARERRIEFTAE